MVITQAEETEGAGKRETQDCAPIMLSNGKLDEHGWNPTSWKVYQPLVDEALVGSGDPRRQAHLWRRSQNGRPYKKDMGGLRNVPSSSFVRCFGRTTQFLAGCRLYFGRFLKNGIASALKARLGVNSSLFFAPWPNELGLVRVAAISHTLRRCLLVVTSLLEGFARICRVG
ncbi:hypothetical protein VFPBJ_11758 [Purpureocillium lilacinum]|uniref:Uncharacterized protein n=1 Tax=Purpureocillium lilacinum TaxID=33203 RepID=A0A179EW17_PURLI|nr:hypothetical protein VFPBJ_11758 [Purpureocillium lilacinum]